MACCNGDVFVDDKAQFFRKIEEAESGIGHSGDEVESGGGVNCSDRRTERQARRMRYFPAQVRSYTWALYQA